MAKIAVINDDPDFINLMCMVLQDEGYETVTSHKGADTMNLVREESPDVILMDIVMERWDTGFNTISMLRLRPDTASIPIVICTARAPQEIDAMIERTNLARLSVLYKPFDLEQLSEAIGAALHSRIREVDSEAHLAES